MALVPCGACLCRRRSSEYEPRWEREGELGDDSDSLIARRAGALGEIVIGPSLIIDHFPNVLWAKLAAAEETWG